MCTYIIQLLTGGLRSCPPPAPAGPWTSRRSPDAAFNVCNNNTYIIIYVYVCVYCVYIYIYIYNYIYIYIYVYIYIYIYQF